MKVECFKPIALCIEYEHPKYELVFWDKLFVRIKLNDGSYIRKRLFFKSLDQVFDFINKNDYIKDYFTVDNYPPMKLLYINSLNAYVKYTEKLEDLYV